MLYEKFKLACLQYKSSPIYLDKSKPLTRFEAINHKGKLLSKALDRDALDLVLQSPKA